MKSHESSRNQKLPDFVVAHDGTQTEIPERERAIVAQKFSSLIDDTLLNFADKVKHFNAVSPKDRLTLRLPISSDEYWSISAEAKTEPPKRSELFKPDEQIVKALSIQRVASEYGHEQVSYRMGADRIVLRWDGGDAYEEGKEARKLGVGPREITPDMSAQEALAITAMNLQESLNAIPNARLEREMGINFQPVGLQEIDGLADFVMQSGVFAVGK